MKRNKKEVILTGTLDGRVVRSSVPAATALVGLPSGFYIVGGTKVIVR